MKRTTFIILVLLFATFTMYAQQGISFKFTANHSCEYVALDSVLIENLTQGGDTTLYWNDTVLTFNIVIGIINAEITEFFVFQNYPNPFETKTNIDIFVPEEDEYSIYVYDIEGREVANYINVLENGIHNFTFYAGNSISYILTLQSDKNVQHIKMIQFGQSGIVRPKIIYNEIVFEKEFVNKTKSIKSYFPYNIGDELRFTCYVSGEYLSITDSPMESKEYFFDLANEVPDTPTADAHQVFDNMIVWNWNQVIKADGYKYNYVNDYSSATDNGISTTYTQSVLKCKTTYNLYVWAYNKCGESTELIMSETTIDPCDEVTPPDGYGIVESNCKCWLDRNLGASRVATSSTDENSYGYLFQWGRGYDGHQNRNSGKTNILSNKDNPGHANFITNSISPFDWRIPQNNKLWQGIHGINNPCPSGWRIPTNEEINAERLSWTTRDAAGAFSSPLKLPLAGRRSDTGLLEYAGSSAFYWTSTVDYNFSRRLYFESSYADMGSSNRAPGFSVRCIKD